MTKELEAERTRKSEFSLNCFGYIVCSIMLLAKRFSVFFMKLRIRGNSIRLRLNQPEVESLKTQGVCRDRTEFPNGVVFSYSLIVDDKVEVPKAEFENSSILIKIPSQTAQKWLSSDEEIGIYSSDKDLKITVEKDFRCLMPRGEEDEDAFPHPKGN